MLSVTHAAAGGLPQSRMLHRHKRSSELALTQLDKIRVQTRQAYPGLPASSKPSHHLPIASWWLTALHTDHEM